MPKVFAGLDVADKTTAICVMAAGGEIMLEASANTEVGAIGDILKPYRRVLGGVALESGNKGMWLAREMLRKKWPIICLDARHTQKALSAAGNKTDKNDARGIAEVLSRGVYRTAHLHTSIARAGRAILRQRAALVRKRGDLERLVRGVLKYEGARLVRKGTEFAFVSARGQRLDSNLQAALLQTLKTTAAIQAGEKQLDLLVRRLSEADPVCRRLMTVPGVGHITAFAFRMAVDDPSRFSSSRDVAAYFGLTPRTVQSGETSSTLGITRLGDREVRSLLYQAGGSVIVRCKTPWRVRTWAVALAERRGHKVAAVACARRLAVIMHRMWVTGRDFDAAA